MSSRPVTSVPGAPSNRANQRIRQHRDVIHQRVRAGFLLLAAGYLFLACRLVYIQIYRHKFYMAEAARIRQHTFILPAQRGGIFDRNGVPLAVNVQVGDLVADPTAIADAQQTATILAGLVPGASADDLQSEIAAAQAKKNKSGQPIKFAVLQKALPYDVVRKIQVEAKAEQKAHFNNLKIADNLAGISVNTRSVRNYPNGDLAAQVVGFVNLGDTNAQGSSGIIGKYGIEKSLNSTLAGVDGSVTAETDAQGRIIPGTEITRTAPVDGRNITLTIDSTIQRIAQDELEKSWSMHHAASGSVVVLDPNNGDILALASLPTYDPNNLHGTANLQWHNAAVTDLYEPGSTMKTLTLSAVLDSKGLQHQFDRVVCTGALEVGNHTIHCAKDPPLFGIHGVEDMRDVLKNSCNIGAAEYALALGPDKLFEYEKRFGLLERPATGLPGEQYCHLIAPERKKWSEIELANIAFGQGISMTPLQLTSIYATLAHNGVRVHPHILVSNAYAGPKQQVVKPEVASTMLSMLQTVVEDGTGKPAQIGGFNVGGKTGSAQVAEHGHYGDEYVGSFCGIVPLTRPKLVILCAINKPVGVHWGAVVAAPVVHNVARRALWYLREPPDNTQLVDYDVKHGVSNLAAVTPAVKAKVQPAVIPTEAKNERSGGNT